MAMFGQLIDGGRTRPERLRNRVTVTLIAGMLLVLIGASGKGGPLTWAYSVTLAPVVSSLSSAGRSTGQVLGVASGIGRLSGENARLARENAELKGRLAATGDTARENADLRRELGIKAITPHKLIPAQVVAYQPESYRQFVTIDAGRRQGISPGMAAMSDGVTVGVIASAGENTSRLQLVSDPEFKIVARDQDTGATGILRGQLGGGLSLEKVAATDAIKPGDAVATNGSGPVPANLYLGQIQAVHERGGSIFRSAQLSPAAPATSLRLVMVVAGP